MITVSLEEANEYFTLSRPHSDEWSVSTDTDKQKFLNFAINIINSFYTFPDQLTDPQLLRVQIGIFEQALWSIKRPHEYPEALTKGILSASVGAVSTTFSKDFIAPLLCEEAKYLIGEIGTPATLDGIGKIKTYHLGW